MNPSSDKETDIAGSKSFDPADMTSSRLMALLEKIEQC